jgi:adenylate cyclase
MIPEPVETLESTPRRENPAPAISAMIEWLAGDECHVLDAGGLAAGLGRRLRAAGLPLDYLS